MPNPRTRNRTRQFIFAATLLVAVCLAFGKVRAAHCQSVTTASPKTYQFAAVSIRPNKTGGPQQFGAATADGYSMHNMFLAAPILTAYVPLTGGASSYSDDQIVGLAPWLVGDEDHYDIEAKIDDAELAQWQNPQLQPAMLRSMLQGMLADRLKLAVHRGTKASSVYALVVAKNGPKFKETNPADPHPLAHPLPGGGRLSMEHTGSDIVIHYFGITMDQLASMWSGQDGRPVVNKTGLAGKYDLSIQKPATPVTPGQPASTAQDSAPSTFTLAEELGLKLESAKGEVETLVIDHVERPTPN